MAEHNGWKNYETWCVNLWLSNDEGAYRHVTELAEAVVGNGPYNEYVARDDAEEDEKLELSEQLKDLVLEWADESGCLKPSLFSDLLGAALEAVDWDEIAEHWLESVREDIKRRNGGES